MTDEEKKGCTKCGIEKPISEFYMDKRTEGKRLAACKRCVIERTSLSIRRKYWANHEASKEAARTRMKGRKFNREKDKVYAGNKIRSDVHEGRLKKPDSCQECGVKSNLQGHHADYMSPTTVEWLCSKCHGKRHRRIA